MDLPYVFTAAFADRPTEPLIIGTDIHKVIQLAETHFMADLKLALSRCFNHRLVPGTQMRLFTGTVAELAQVSREKRQDWYGQPAPGTECARTACHQPAFCTHMDDGRFYCVRCARKINEYAGKDLVYIPTHLNVSHPTVTRDTCSVRKLDDHGD